MTECKHHWVIESTSLTVARGECKLCGETKVFTTNVIEVWTHQEQINQLVCLARDNKIRAERESREHT